MDPLTSWAEVQGAQAPKSRPAAPEQEGTTVGTFFGIAGLVFGLGLLVTPYFAAVFLVPVTIACGAIAVWQGRKVLGLAGLGLGLVGLLWVGSVSSGFTSTTNAGPDLRANLVVEGVTCETRPGGSTWIEGSVRNAGSVSARFVEVRLTFQDRGGSVVDTGSSYAVGGEMLRPGESSTFTGYTDHASARRCFASILDYDVAE